MRRKRARVVDSVDQDKILEEPDLPPPEAEEDRGAFQLFGSGGFSCAILQSGGTIIRATQAKDETIKQKVEHADALLEIFNGYQDMLGPSVLQVVQPGQWWEPDDIPKQLRNALNECKNIDLKDADIYLQEVEFGSGGDFEPRNAMLSSPEYDAQFAFCLIWFFYVAQAQFGFIHRDVKGENIVLRKTSQPMTYIFVLGKKREENHLFSFVAPYVPVVIDLDLGTFYKADTGQRSEGGTLSHMPPRVLLDIITSRKQRFDPYSDWYSLGVTLLAVWLRPVQGDDDKYFVYYTVDEHYQFYTMLTGKKSTDLNNRIRYSVVHFLMSHVVWHYALQGTWPLPQAERFFSIVFARESYLWLEKRIRAFSEGQRQLLKRLLAWDPQERAFWGETHRLLTDMSLFDSMRKRSPQEIDSSGFGKLYTYGIYPAMEALPPDSDRKKMLLNALGNMKGIQSCASCGRNSLSIPRPSRGIESVVTALRLCSCCHLPFCSVECQESAH